ncbi:MAG: glycosyltransferase [Pseudomonadota bacterium]
MGLITDQNRDAGHAHAVVFACDDGHLPFASFAADRILRTEPDGTFDIVICMPDISNVSEAHRAGPIRYCQVDMSALPDVPMVKAWITNATYFRWVLPSAFADTYETLFYLDTDTYLARPGIQRLFDSVDKPVALSASVEFQSFASVDAGADTHYLAKTRDLGGRNGEYYNAGVFLSQPEAFLAMDGPRRLVEAVVKNVEYLPIHRDQDQGAMNLAFADDILPLNPLYNWRSRAWLHQREVDRYDPYVLHFAGRGKPWNRQDDPFIASFATEYLDYLAQEFPNFAPQAALRSKAWREDNPKHKTKLFEDIRIWLYLRRNAKMLKKHQDAGMDVKFAGMDAAIKEAVVG